MITIKDLPIAIRIGERQFNFAIHVTAWNKLCVCYKEVFDAGNIILSCVVEPDGKILIPKHYDDIADARTIDEALFITWGRLMEMVKKNIAVIVKEQ